MIRIGFFGDWNRFFFGISEVCRAPNLMQGPENNPGRAIKGTCSGLFRSLH